MSQKLYVVEDSSCTAVSTPREHTVIVNDQPVPVTFVYGQRTELEYDVAMKFASVEGFTVSDLEGREVTVPKVVANTIKQLQVAPDEVIAKYTELSLEALQVRAAASPDGEKFVGVDQPEILIDFLMNGLTVDDEENLIDDDLDEGDGTDELPPPPALPPEGPVAGSTPEENIPAEPPFDPNGVDAPVETKEEGKE